MARRAILALTLGACRPEDRVDELAYDYATHAETPAILRDVALIDDAERFTRPYVPGHRTTMDGRVGLRVQGGFARPSFFLFVPEKLSAPILDGPTGTTILSDPEPFDVVFPPPLDGVLGHHAICDPTTEFPVDGERPNPYTCGSDGLHDCYDLTVITSTNDTVRIQLWGVLATVEVAAPKTVDARILDVRFGEPVAGAVISATNDWTEPSVTIDGRLLTGRLGRFPRSWENPETGEVFVRPYDLAYSVLPASASPCDVTGWTQFNPMSHAPYDPAMKPTYGLAAYPFRDTEGNLIPDGEDLGGTYPWVDREGANVFMTGVHGRLVEQSTEKYPRRCVTEGCEAYKEYTDWDRGFMAGGLWTHGKFVHLDGMINNVDWAVSVSPAGHYLVDLYNTEDGAPVPVRVGAGRFTGEPGPNAAGYTLNPNILDSLEHLLNQHPMAAPITPRDVVWVMSSGVATDEIVFDDLLDPESLIVSNMQASITQFYSEAGESLAIPRHWNGQVRTLRSSISLLFDYPLEPELDEDIHLQNAATSVRWHVPAYGLIRAGTARVEPVALGGVFGRGLWLSGQAEVRYSVPAQDEDVTTRDAYIGVFVDARSGDGEQRVLFEFPDGTGVRLVGRTTVQYTSAGEVVHSVELPATDGWVHFGWRLRDGFRDVTFLYDGFPLDRYQGRPLFVPVEGDLVLGRYGDEGTGLRGWVDDLMVLLHDVDDEVACNHADGTLVEVNDSATWSSVAAAYPSWAHAQIGAAAHGDTGGRFACYLDHSADRAAHLQNIPAGTTSVRQRVLFPEGPLAFGEPRPDSTANQFCLDCHEAEGKRGLSLAALELHPGVMAEDDARRQPLQPPRRVFGNIPAGWIPVGSGPGGPSAALQAPPEGVLIDQWTLSNAK